MDLQLVGLVRLALGVPVATPFGLLFLRNRWLGADLSLFALLPVVGFALGFASHISTAAVVFALVRLLHWVGAIDSKVSSNWH